MRKALTLLIALLCVNLAFAQNTPLACQTDASAGLKWENGGWRLTNFVDRKFILVLSGNTLTKDSVSKAWRTEASPTRIVCDTNFDSSVSCHGRFGETLVLNPLNYRGGISLIFGTTSENNKRDTVSVEAFTCQPF